MTDRSYDVTDYIAIPCPVCKAPIGVACTIGTGPRDRAAHLARQDRAVRAKHAAGQRSPDPARRFFRTGRADNPWLCGAFPPDP